MTKRLRKEIMIRSRLRNKLDKSQSSNTLTDQILKVLRTLKNYGSP